MCGTKCLTLTLATIEEQFAILEEADIQIPNSLQRVVAVKYAIEYTDLKSYEKWLQVVWVYDANERYGLSVANGPSFARINLDLDDAEDASSYADAWLEAVFSNKFLGHLQDMPNDRARVMSMIQAFVAKFEAEEDNMPDKLAELIIDGLSVFRALDTVLDPRPSRRSTAFKDVAFIAPIDKTDRKSCFGSSATQGKALMAAIKTDFWDDLINSFRTFVGPEGKHAAEFYKIEKAIQDAHKKWFLTSRAMLRSPSVTMSRSCAT